MGGRWEEGGGGGGEPDIKCPLPHNIIKSNLCIIASVLIGRLRRPRPPVPSSQHPIIHVPWLLVPFQIFDFQP